MPKLNRFLTRFSESKSFLGFQIDASQKEFMKQSSTLLFLWLLDGVLGGCDDFVSSRDTQLSKYLCTVQDLQ